MVYGIQFSTEYTQLRCVTRGRIKCRPEAVAGARCRGSRSGGYVGRIYLYRSSCAAILSSSRRHRTSAVRVRPGAFLLDAARPTDNDTSAAAQSIFYIHIWTLARRSRLLVAKGYVALFTLEI